MRHSVLIIIFGILELKLKCVIKILTVQNVLLKNCWVKARRINCKYNQSYVIFRRILSVYKILSLDNEIVDKILHDFIFFIVYIL